MHGWMVWAIARVIIYLILSNWCSVVLVRVTSTRQKACVGDLYRGSCWRREGRRKEGRGAVRDASYACDYHRNRAV